MSRIRIVALHFIILVILVGRRPEAVFKAQFWAEDGAIFFAQQLEVGFWHALILPYSGYLHAFPRIFAALLSVLPIHALPTAYGISSIAIATGCCCTFSWPRFRCLVSSDLIRAICCVVMASAIPAGSELIGSITNLQWFLAPVAILFVFSVREVTRPVAIATVMLLLLIALSSPALFVALPFFLWQVVTRHGWPRWNSIALTLGLLVEFVVVIRTHAGGNKGHWNFDSVLISTVASGVSKCILAPILGSPFLLEQSTRSFVASMLLALLLGLILLVVLFMKLAEWRQRFIVLAATYIGVASVAVVMGGRNLAEAFLTPKEIPHIQGERYFFLPSCVFLFLSAFAVDFISARISHSHLKRLPALLLLLTFSAGMARNYQTPPLIDFDWSRYALQIEEWDRLQRENQRVGPLQVPLNPPTFYMTLEPRR